MKTLSIVCKHTGEISYTPRDPRGHVVGFDGDIVTAMNDQEETFEADLTETCSRLISSDWWEPCTVDLWELRDVTVFDWMTGADFLRNAIAVRWFKGFGGSLEWSKAWFYRLDSLGEIQRFAAIKLLNVKKFRSPFRQSLRTQLEAWLNEPEHRFPSPFSFRQWEAVCDVYTSREAKQRSEAIYRNRALY